MADYDNPDLRDSQPGDACGSKGSCGKWCVAIVFDEGRIEAGLSKGACVDQSASDDFLHGQSVPCAARQRLQVDNADQGRGGQIDHWASRFLVDIPRILFPLTFCHNITRTCCGSNLTILSKC
jgi:hypothetical protein